MITCIFENNGKGLLRHVTVNAMIIKDHKILLGKRGTVKGKPITESGKWGLLGGFFGRDENLIQALKREVMEESGWEITNLKLFRINDSPNRPKEDRQNVDMIFTAEALQQTGSSDEEVTHLEWFDLDKLPPPELIAFDHGENLGYIKNIRKKTSRFRCWGDLTFCFSATRSIILTVSSVIPAKAGISLKHMIKVSSYKSFHSGFFSLINLIFHNRFHFLFVFLL